MRASSTRPPWEKLVLFETVRIEYSGSGDEGYIEAVYPVPDPGGTVEFSHELTRELEDWAYDLLEEHYAGWEINEGSHGDITLFVKERKVLLHHGERVENTRWFDTEIHR